MDRETFEKADGLIDDIAESVDSLLPSEQLADLRKTLEQLGKALGPRYTVEFSIKVDVFDREREAALPMLNTGLAISDGRPPHRTWGDSSPQRYVLHGEIQIVPHDRCPKCWSDWSFKFDNPSCSNCGVTLGGACKVLLDSDTCPHCEEGAVSLARPKCDRCGYEVDPTKVTWG
jgi:hypothetical protein